MKKVLLFGPPFFNYTQQVKVELESLGYTVDYFNDRPSDISFEKAILRLRPSILNKRIEHYLASVLEKTKDKQYHLILIINGRVLRRDFVRKLVERNPTAHSVLYLWDSLRLYPDAQALFSEVDVSYSFDSKDCEDHAELTQLPLFYHRAFAQVAERSSEASFDLISVCTAHPNRYQFMQELFPKLRAQGVRLYSYMYLNRLQYLYYRMTNQAFRHARRQDFSFRALPMEQYLEKLALSRCVFDMNHEGQTGLTMRTIETLGAKKKLITSNRRIEQYDFYDPANILIIDPGKEAVDQILDFLKSDYREIPESVYRKYSIQQFVKTLIGGDDEQV